jgi:hypothetical protein
MKEDFTATQKEVVARKMGYNGPMHMFDEFLMSTPAEAKKYSLITSKLSEGMAKGGAIVHYAKGGQVIKGAQAKQVTEAKKMIREMIIEDDVDPNVIIKLSQMANDVIKDASLYPRFRQELLANDLAEEEDVREKIDYQALAIFSTLGVLTQQMVESGELGA